jgi:hypothetical protein
MKIDQRIANELYSIKPDSELLSIEKKLELNTGITAIDADFGFPAGYYVIAGNPGAGKSWFALWLARVFWKHNGKKSVYFSLEMPEPIVRQRILQQWSDLNKADYENRKSELSALDNLRQDVIIVDTFYSEDSKKQNVKNFTDLVNKYYDLGYRCFHFDHLHELDGANVNQTNQKVTEDWAKGFQNIVKDKPEIWIFVYAQPNGAAAEKKILRRTDISGSKAITQKCDYFLSLNRIVNLDENGIMITNSNDRQVILYIDKSRYTEKVHIGFKLFFSETANFYSMSGARE